MGSYHTFFVATEADLDRLFPNWVPPKPEQLIHEGMNPFTRQKTQVAVWEAITEPTPLGSPSLNDDVWGAAAAPVVPPANEYMVGLEDQCAPGLRALPHFRAKNLVGLCDLDVLEKLLDTPTPVPPARIGAEEDADMPMVQALTDAAARRLLSLDELGLAAVARGLMDADFTLGDPDDELRAMFLETAVRPLRALAEVAIGYGGRVCHIYAMHP